VKRLAGESVGIPVASILSLHPCSSITSLRSWFSFSIDKFILVCMDGSR
jgi:hypothetical protein